MADAKSFAEKAGETLAWSHLIKAYHIIRKMELGTGKEVA